MDIFNRTLILLITDFRGLIPQRIMAWDGYDLAMIKGALEDSGLDVKIIGAHEIDFSKIEKRKHIAAIYASSQEPRYKQYLEDIIINLHFHGILLYPAFEHMLAHEDKAFQAMRLSRTDINAPRSYVLGSKEHAYKFLQKAEYPLVGKTVCGYGSQGVYFIRNESDGRRFVDNNLIHQAFKKGRPLLKRAWERVFKPKPVLGILLFQDFIPHLKGDWKILMWDDKICGVYRENRLKDFRASGSGKVFFSDIPIPVLDFALDARRKLGLPWASFDIGYDGNRCYLFEYQGIHFGLTAADRGLFYYLKNTFNIWEKRLGQIQVETEMADIVIKDLSKRGWF